MEKPEKRKLDAATNPTAEDTSSNTHTPDKRRKVIGPALPPPEQTADEKRPAADEDSDGDSDDDEDDFGPSLPPPEGTAPAPASEPSTTQNTVEKTQTQPQQRDAWMLHPPTGLGFADASRVDPTKLRNRKFQTGRAAGHTPATGGVDSSWTETPEEKMRRLQNEAMGIVSATSTSTAGAGAGAGAGKNEKKARDMREKIQRYNERVRGDGGSESLVEEKRRKAKAGKEEEEDDPSKRAFDKEKDMALSSKLTNAQRREVISKASDFGSRFTKGKFL